MTSEGGKGHHAKLTKSVVVSYWSCCQITHPSKGSSRGKLFPGESQQSNSEIAKSQAHAGVSCFPLDCTVSAQIEACACSNNRLTTLKQSCETGAFIIYHLVWPCWIQLQGLVRKQKVNKAVNQLPVPSLQLTLGQTWLDTSRRMDIFDTRCVAASWRIWNANHCKPRSVMICAQSTWEV